MFYYLKYFTLVYISGAEVKSRKRLPGRLEPVLAGVVRTLGLDDVEGVGVTRVVTGVSL